MIPCRSANRDLAVGGKFRGAGQPQIPEAGQSMCSRPHGVQLMVSCFGMFSCAAKHHQRRVGRDNFTSRGVTISLQRTVGQPR
jgi:hypothetical protein